MNFVYKKSILILFSFILSIALIFELNVFSYADDDDHPYPRLNRCDDNFEGNLKVPKSSEPDFSGQVQAWQYVPSTGVTISTSGWCEANKFEGPILVGRVYHYKY